MDHAAIAQSLYAQHRNRAAFRPLELASGGDLTDAYAIQEALQALFVADRNVTIAGYKIALTSRAMQEFVGVDEPLAGAIFSDRVHESPATLDLSAFNRLGVECEIAVRLGSDLPGGDEAHTAESVADAIDAIMPAFELIEDRNADYDTIDAFSLVADNCWNGGIVIGAPVRDWRSIALLSARGVLNADGKAAGEGRGRDALGNPLSAVAWLADLFAAQGRPLSAGMVVMTGSIVKTRFPAPGEYLEFSVDGLGGASLRLAGR